jgi:hypothetical protein
MYIEPALPAFDYVTIRRSGGFIGLDQALHIDRDLDAHVSDRIAGSSHSFTLDAYTANELMVALARLTQARPEPSHTLGCDMLRYDIELSAGGTVYHISSVDLGADEALHGVMLAANHLLDGEPFPIHPMSPMTLHTVHHAD